MSLRAFWKRRWIRVVAMLGLSFVAFAGGTIAYVQQETQFYQTFDSKKAHHQKGKFTNPWARTTIPQPLDLMWEFLTSKVDQSLHPAQSVTKEYKAKRLYQKTDGLTWLGHASFQFRLKEANLLTDPILSKRSSPFSFAGPKRFQPPGLSVKEIGKVDIILISHNHYDHLDRATLKSLPNRADIDVFVPLGVGKVFSELGYRKVHSLDWWESREIRGLRITCLPVQHFSGRGLTDRNRTLWAGWGIFAKDLKIFFGGDTGYYNGFKDIGQKLGPFDLALMPIGAYEPRRHFRPIHMNPEEAVQATRDLRAKSAVGIHWGTFPLSLEPPLDPPKRFLKAANKAGFPKGSVFVMKIGETVPLPRHTTQKNAPPHPHATKASSTPPTHKK